MSSAKGTRGQFNFVDLTGFHGMQFKIAGLQGFVWWIY